MAATMPRSTDWAARASWERIGELLAARDFDAAQAELDRLAVRLRARPAERREAS